jgi:hypothetical protein
VLRSWAILAAVVLLVAAPAMAQESSGFPVTDATSGISVTMPAEVQSQEQAIPGSDFTIRYYLAEADDVTTALYVFEVSEADGGYSLDGGVQGSADGVGGTIVAATPVDHQGHEGRDFELAVTDPASGVPGIVLSRLVWTGQTVVQLQAVGSEDDRAQVEEQFAGLVASLDLGDQAIGTPGPGVLPAPSDAPSASPAG